MEPAYTTVQPGNLYPVGSDFMLDYNPSVSSHLVSRYRGPSRPMQGFDGLGALGAVDVRPYVTFFTGAGAVSLIIDPTTLLSGVVVFPVVGSVPYDLDIINWQLILHVPLAGDVPVPLFGGGSGNGTVAIPGLGDIPYEITFGPPALPPSALFSSSNLLGVLGGGVLPLLFIGFGLWFLWKK